MDNINQSAIKKIIGMFTPAEENFFDFDKDSVIVGPNDRAIVGCDTYFPKKWLTEDFGFTDDEADWFIEQVKSQSGIEK